MQPIKKQIKVAKKIKYEKVRPVETSDEEQEKLQPKDDSAIQIQKQDPQTYDNSFNYSVYAPSNHTNEDDDDENEQNLLRVQKYYKDLNRGINHASNIS